MLKTMSSAIKTSLESHFMILSSEVIPEAVGWRASKFVVDIFGHHVGGRRRVAKLFKDKNIQINNVDAQSSNILKLGDRVSLKKDMKAFYLQDTKAKILFEDDYICVLWKENGESTSTDSLGPGVNLDSTKEYIIEDGAPHPKRAKIEKEELAPESDNKTIPPSSSESMSEAECNAVSENAPSEEKCDKSLLSLQQFSGLDGFIRFVLEPTTQVHDRLDHFLGARALYVVNRSIAGIVVLAKTKTSFNVLSQYLENTNDDADGPKKKTLTRFYKAIIHNTPRPENFLTENEDGYKCASFSTSSVTNCSRGQVSNVDFSVEGKTFDCRNFFLKKNYPVVGNGTKCQPTPSSPSKGTYVSLIGVEFPHPITQEMMSFKVEEPARFNSLRTREEKFYQVRQVEALKQLKEAGLDMPDYQVNTGLPIAYILQKQEFHGLSFFVNPDVLIPKPSSQTLVDAALLFSKTKNAPTVLDLGTGCGCLLLSTLHSLPDATGIGTDISPKALDIAQKNSVSLKMEDRASFINLNFSNLHDGAVKDQSFDIVICNPPYLESIKNGHKHEPTLALLAKNQGI